MVNITVCKQSIVWLRNFTWTTFNLEMTRAANSPVYGQSAKGFETVC